MMESMAKSPLKTTTKKPTISRIGSSLSGPKKFRQPALFALIAFCIVAGAVLIYASFAGSIPVVTENPDFWRPRIMYCESGGRPTASNGSGHYGLYQYDVRTWKGAVGAELAAKYPLPSDAPEAIQNQAFYNTWARRGSQPWNASFHCWATDEIKAKRGSVLPITLPKLGPVATATPAPPPKNASNIVVQGRVYVDNKLAAGVGLASCVEGVIPKTDAGGVFRFELPAGKNYCVRVIDGLPSGSTLSKINNNPEHINDKSYENQLADTNYSHNIWQIFTPYYSWDRTYDEDFDFYFVTK